MRHKILLIGILLLLTFSPEVVAQQYDGSIIRSSMKAYNGLTSKGAKYSLDYLKDKNTLYFKYEQKEKVRFGYKAILGDIHPEGIFIIERSETKFLRVLSINNGKVFIKENYRGKFRTSNNVNFIEIELPGDVSAVELNELVSSLKSIFVEKEEKAPRIVLPPRTKKD